MQSISDLRGYIRNLKKVFIDYVLPPTERSPWDDLCNILRGSQRMVKVLNGEETTKHSGKYQAVE